MGYRGWPHLLYSGFNCDSKALMDKKLIYEFLRDAPERIGMKLLGDPVVHEVTTEQHPDIGITGIAIITTSHLSIHTFPMGQNPESPTGISVPFFTFDAYSCQNFKPRILCDILQQIFRPEVVEKDFIYRLKRKFAKEKFPSIPMELVSQRTFEHEQAVI